MVARVNSACAAGVLALALPLLPAVLAAEGPAPFAFDKAPGRLPKQIVPLVYQIAVTPHPQTLSFSGRESVQLQFRSAAASIVFNSLNESLRDVRFDGKPVRAVHSDNARQLTSVTLAAPAAPGTHSLSFLYEGRIETDPVGLFLQRYRKADGAPTFLLATQMEPTDARRMFPCWDEPAFRASFQLSVTVPADWATVSNMPRVSRVVHGALATTTFAHTPRMPSYLLEFSTGDLRAINARAEGVRLGVWAVSGEQRDGAYALANAREILADYNRYFDYRYPLPKLDSIAIPGGFSGAMENWGAITYTEEELLAPPDATLARRQDIFATQAHEMAHQWNGDLVTMGWWDDLWLNESFASWMAAKETALRNPGWKWWEVQDADKETAMSADAQPSSHAIVQRVTDELQANNAFDPAITYSKGQAVLHMLETYLGPEVFRDGIRRYIKARAFANASAGDLWQALSAASGRDVAQLAAPWTEQAGFPLVDVAARCDESGRRTLTLAQQRFLLRGRDAAAAHWSIPLRLRVGATGVPSALLLTRDRQTVAAGSCDEALSLNADAVGFYRVRYDPSTLAAITHQFDRLPDADRIAVLDDQWALVQANAAPLPSYLALVGSMGPDFDSRAWTQITAALAQIVEAARGTPDQPAVSAYARALIEPLAERLGWSAQAGETPGQLRLRRSLRRELGEWGDAATLSAARARFALWLKNPRTIDPDDVGTVLSLVALEADASTFEQLHALARAPRTSAVQRAAYLALMQVRAEELAGQAAQIAVSNEIPNELQPSRLELLAILAHQHPQIAWQTFRAHAHELLAPFGSSAPFMLAREIPEMFCDGAPLDQLEDWVRSQLPAELSGELARGMESARYQQDARAALRAAAAAYIRTRDSTSRRS